MSYQRRFPWLVLLIIFCSSCNVLFDISDENKFVECTKSNCYDLKIDGSIIDKVTNNSIKTIPVTLNWVNPTYSYYPASTINIQFSNDSGSFSFANSIDTSYFSRGYHLSISIPANKDYIIFPQGNTYSVYTPADPVLKNLKYELYPKTQLLIQISREKTDAFETFIVGHSFRKNLGYTDRIIRKSSGQYDFPLNDAFNVETAADIKTYITWTKKINSVVTVKTDSITCKRNITNVYKIKY